MTKQELIKKISDFTDWSYQYSDDHSVYQKGKQQADVLAKFGITTSDLIDSGVDSTFILNKNKIDNYSYFKGVLISDVFYRLQIVHITDQFSFFCTDKNGLHVCAPKKMFNRYFDENLDLREYENKVFKIIWDSLE